MSVLSDTTIKTYAETRGMIKPFLFEQLQPASYDLTLGEMRLGNFVYDEDYLLTPKKFILASTHEIFNLPDTVVGRIEGKSSLARRGLIIHTAGFIDPGFRGQITLEITNLSDEPFLMKRGMRIAQVAFQFLDKPARRPYGHPSLGSHYQDQIGATPSALGS